MILAIGVRHGTLSFAYRYSPKTPQKIEAGKMARTVRDANLETRTARLRLPIRSEPYWRGLEKGFALGYRRRGKGGTWLARRRPAAGGYAEHKIGTSDDLQDADGVAILDYGQAQKTARAWWRTELRREEGHAHGRQADGKEDRGLAPRSCREAGARAFQTRPQAEPPQSRQERGRYS